MLQHEKNINGNDPIPEFTHYRYTVISYEYYEFLYLIENAALWRLVYSVSELL